GALNDRAQGTRRRSLREALTGNTPAIIAEIKKASPSKGLFREDLDPLRLARAFQTGGAAALSVVTEPEFFLGSDNWIAAIRESVTLPILRKDFIVDPIQVAEAAALGADAILLIARILDPDQIATLTETAKNLNLDILYEVHDADDYSRIKAFDPQIVGINARNLDDFTVDTGAFARLRTLITGDTIAVAESGISEQRQVREFRADGFSAFLIGESLVCADDPAALLQELRGDGNA
ncbi:MAG TPA: indole-3-glycerol phosphate synthase TrpC, partial [candidate division Zixibacteria bacterium]|nr:indole-3-glycerol phosphate synthase TrpC [candidate division Zixibacteria bacterium]